MTAWFLSTCVLIGALMLLRLILKGRMDPRVTYALWLLAALRVLIPVSLFQAPVSVASAAESAGVVDGVELMGGFFAPKYYKEYEMPEAYGDPAALDMNSFVRDLEKDGVFVYDVHNTWTEAPRQEGEAPRHFVRMTVGESSFWRWFHLGGAVVAAGVLLTSNLRFAASLRKRRRPFEGELPADCPLPVYVVDELPSPCLFGIFHPAVYVNQTAVESDHLDHILTHELTHYRHGDHWWAVLRCFCLCAQWSNPLVWAAADLSRQDCETACDASSIKALGEDQRIGYGRTLVDMVAAGHSSSSLLRTATTMTGGAEDIYRRVALIVKKPKMTVVTILAVVLVCALAVGCTFGGAAEGKAPDEPSSVVIAAPAPEESASPAPVEPSTPPAEVRTAEEAEQLARSVFDKVVEGERYRDYFIRVDGGDVYHITPEVYTRGDYSSWLPPFEWGAGSQDGPQGTPIEIYREGAYMRCWSGCDTVELSPDGTERFLVTCGPDQSGTTFYDYLLQIAQQAAMDGAADIKIDGSVSDYEQVAAEYAREFARRNNAMPEWNRERALDVQVRSSGVELVSPRDSEEFFASISLDYKLTDDMAAVWREVGFERETDGPCAGYWKMDHCGAFTRDEDGNWICRWQFWGPEMALRFCAPQDCRVADLQDPTVEMVNVNAGVYYDVRFCHEGTEYYFRIEPDLDVNTWSSSECEHAAHHSSAGAGSQSHHGETHHDESHH